MASKGQIANYEPMVPNRWRSIFAVLVLAAPVSVRADAINVPLVLGYGLAILAPLLAFQTLVEAAILRLGFRLGYREAIRVMFWANVWSVIAGLPTKFLNSWIYQSIVPRNLYDYMRLFSTAMVVGSCVYFVVTVFVEWFVAGRLLRKEGVEANSSRLMTVIALANVATYAICAPLFYEATKPRHSITEFTPDSSWARKPAAELFYISSDTGFLRSVRTDGSGDRLIAPFKMESYLVTVDRNRCVFRGEDMKFYDCDLRDLRRTEIPGKWERWTRIGEVAGLKGQENSIRSGWFGWADWSNWVKSDAWSGYAERGLGASLRITPKGKTTIIFADNPGWLHLGNRNISNIGAVGEAECLFDDRDSIYLLDIERRRIGFVAHGTRFSLVNGPSITVETMQAF
jgi:hypothetical protein